MTATFDAEEFRRKLLELGASLRNAAHQALAASVHAAGESARTSKLFADGPEQSLRKSIVEEVGGLEGKLSATAKHARFVEAGTRPHAIEGRRGGVLRFVVAGEVFFRRRVQHPGTAERPFMREAAQIGQQTLDYGLDYFTDQAIARFNGS